MKNDGMEHIEKTIYSISKTVTGPVMFYYVWWILTEAERRGIRRIYFLARDGFVLYNIAVQFCKQFNLMNIECKYLYCSRKALRTPTYHLIGDEAYELLLLGGNSVTLRSLMERAELTQSQRKKVYQETGLDFRKENEQLSKLQLKRAVDKIRESAIYKELIEAKSREAYEAAVGYLKQEGLVDGEPIAIVDSGWTGSIQRSLRQLLESTGCKVNLVGFYFGMFVNPKEEVDGKYLCWYFDKDSPKKDKILFNNNVFECMLSAPHGMTIGYEADRNNSWRPVLNEGPTVKMLRIIDSQIRGILNYTNDYMPRIEFNRFNAKSAHDETRSLLKQLMVLPTPEEAEAIGAFSFCDDITEFYQMPLADENQVSILKGYIIIPRIIRKLFRIEKKAGMQELFWPYGTIAFLPWFLRSWYKHNVFIWEWLRYTLK